MSKICRTFAAKFEKVMKLYNQPSVELAEVQATSLMQAASPSGLPTGDPVPNEGGD